MNSRERILTALSHKEPDRVPFDLGSSFVTGITKNAYINLMNYLGIEENKIDFFDTVQQLIYPSGKIPYCPLTIYPKFVILVNLT